MIVFCIYLSALGFVTQLIFNLYPPSFAQNTVEEWNIYYLAETFVFNAVSNISCRWMSVPVYSYIPIFCKRTDFSCASFPYIPMSENRLSWNFTPIVFSCRYSSFPMYTYLSGCAKMG